MNATNLGSAKSPAKSIRPARLLCLVAAACAAALLPDTLARAAASDPDQPPLRRPVRPPVIDLEELAQQERPGQVRRVEQTGEKEEETAEKAAQRAQKEDAPDADARAPFTLPEAGEPRPTLDALEPPPEEDYRTEPVTVRVETLYGDPNQVQWRHAPDQPWTTPNPGDTLRGLVDIRTGRAGATVVINDDHEVYVDRLSRVRLRLHASETGVSAAAVHLDRGAIHSQPLTTTDLGMAATPLHLRTRDEQHLGWRAFSAQYNAFTGTRVRSRPTNNHHD